MTVDAQCCDGCGSTSGKEAVEILNSTCVAAVPRAPEMEMATKTTERRQECSVR